MLPALLACVLLFTGCENRDPEKTETVRVGVAIYQQNDTFISVSYTHLTLPTTPYV